MQVFGFLNGLLGHNVLMIFGVGSQGLFGKGFFLMNINFNDAGFFSPCVICQMYDFLIKDQAQLNFSPRLCSERGIIGCLGEIFIGTNK